MASSCCLVLSEQAKLIESDLVFTDKQKALDCIDTIVTGVTAYENEMSTKYHLNKKLLKQQTIKKNYSVITFDQQDIFVYRNSSKTGMIKWNTNRPTAIHCNMCGYTSGTTRCLDIGNYHICSICLEKLGEEAGADIKEIEKTIPDYRELYEKQKFSDSL